MAKSGNKAIPFEVLQGRGTNRKDRHGEEKGQPKVSAKVPVCSMDLPLGKSGRKEWRRVMRVSGSIKPKEIDRGILTMYCYYWERFCDHPETMKAADMTQMRMAAVELGFSPSARMRVAE